MLANEQNILATLKQSRYLDGIPEQSLKQFLPLIKHEHYPVGQTLISQGEENRDVFIILKGTVSVSTDGRQLYTLGRKGDIFGEMSVVSGRASQATVVVVEELETINVSSRLLQQVKDNSSHELSSHFYNWLSRILADKLHLTSAKAKRFEDASAELRESLAVQQKISDSLRQTTLELEKSKAELEELNNLKTELIGIASHDLRSPIGSVITVMETIPACYELDAELIDLLKEVKETCNEQLTLVNDLLDLARIESGRLELEATSFSFDQLVQIFQQVEKRARLLSRNKQLQITLQIDEMLQNRATTSGDPLFISFDVPKIQQVLNNLLGNAIKFTPDLGRIEIALQLDPEQNLLVQVRDSGIGIPAEELPQIFNKFHQVKRRKTGTRGERGTGLGLSICKNMVDLHGGKIWVDSRIDEGSTFSFTLPLGR